MADDGSQDNDEVRQIRYRHAHRILKDLSVLPSGRLSIADLLFLTTRCRYAQDGSLTVVAAFTTEDLMRLREIRERVFDLDG